MPKFKSVYALADGENVKRIPKPFIPERLEYYRARMHPAQVQAIPRGPDFYALTYDGNDFEMITAWFGQPDVEGLIGSVLGIERELLIGPPAVLHKVLAGDIVVRKGATPEQKRAGFVEMLSKGVGKPLSLQQQDMQREAIVVSGKLVYQAPTPATMQSAIAQAFGSRAADIADPASTAAPDPRRRGRGPRIVLYIGKRQGNGWSNNNPDQFIRQIAQASELPVVVEGDIGGRGVMWEMDSSAYNARRGRNLKPDPAQIDELLNNIQSQSQLHFSRETRTIKTWVLSDSALP